PVCILETVIATLATPPPEASVAEPTIAPVTICDKDTEERPRSRVTIERIRVMFGLEKELRDKYTARKQKGQRVSLTLRLVAHALLRAASRLFSTPCSTFVAIQMRREESRRGTQECVRHQR